MFEKEVEKLNKYIEEQPPMQYEKRIYTVDEI